MNNKEEMIDGVIQRALCVSKPMESSPACRQMTTLLLGKYGDRSSFLHKVSPAVQTAFARHPDSCYFGDYPTLGQLNAAYGRTMASQWLVAQLTNLSEFSGARDVTANQLEDLSRIVAQEYHWLKITELLLFFYKFKTGRYGRFYGSVDPLVITTALREFVGERNAAYARHEQQERERIEEEERKAHPPVTREEWLLMKENKSGRNSEPSSINNSTQY